MSAALALALYIALFGIAALAAFVIVVGVLIIFCSALNQIVKEVKQHNVDKGRRS